MKKTEKEKGETEVTSIIHSNRTFYFFQIEIMNFLDFFCSFFFHKYIN